MPVRTLTAARSIVPDVAAIAELSQQYGANGMMVFSTMTVEQSSSVHTRMFAPLIGIVEDPATGARAAPLAPIWCSTESWISDLRPRSPPNRDTRLIVRPAFLIQVNSDDDAIQGVMVGGIDIGGGGTLSC